MEYSKLKPGFEFTIFYSYLDLNSDELLAKRGNLERVKEFSKNLKSFNRELINSQSNNVKKKSVQISAREKAIAFAKNIPKPKPKVNAESAESSENIGIDIEEYDAIEELASKHLQNKKQVDAIKKSLGFT